MTTKSHRTHEALGNFRHPYVADREHPLGMKSPTTNNLAAKVEQLRNDAEGYFCKDTDGQLTSSMSDAI